MLGVAILLVARGAWAQAGAPAPPAQTEQAIAKDAKQTARPTAEDTVKGEPRDATRAAAKDPARPTAKAQPTAKPRPGKVVSLDAASVNGERQRPKAAYVLQPNLKAVRDAANSITEDHVQSERKR